MNRAPAPIRSDPFTGGINGCDLAPFRRTASNSRLLVQRIARSSRPITQDQRKVAIGAASGIAAMILLVFGLSTVIPAPHIANNAADRLAYALCWATLPALLFFAMVAAVGNARFSSEAIDPTVGKETPKMVIDGRVADNTLQQLVLFLVGMFGLAVTLPLHRLGIIAAVSITFVIVRIAFWIGYRIKPVYRAFGFSSTAYMNLGMLLATLWMWLR